MQDSNDGLIWLDAEMTGLDPERDHILELAIIVTTADLQTIAQSEVWVVHQPESVLETMDDWSRRVHGDTGLTERVRRSRLSLQEVEAQALSFVVQHVPAGKSPMCGNSIWQDRRFLARYMPRLEQHFMHRNIDVSSLKELCKRWSPQVASGWVKAGAHEALADIRESIEELRYYRTHFLRIAKDAPAV